MLQYPRLSCAGWREFPSFGSHQYPLLLTQPAFVTLGHADIKITMGYANLISENKREAVSILQSLFSEINIDHI